MTVLQAIKRNKRKRMIRQWLRELPYVLGTMLCFIGIGILLSFGI